MDINRRYPVLIRGAIIIALVWGAHFFSFFHLLNGFAYDSIMRFYLSADASEQLILLDGDQQYAERGDEVWLPLLKNVLAQDVKQVVFNFFPERVSEEFYQLAADSGKVVFGQHVQSSDPYSAAKLRPLPQAAQGKNIPFGIVGTPSSQRGIYRTQELNINIDGHNLPTLEHVAAQRALGKSTALKASDYLINFSGGSARIPKINVAQALSGGLVSELVTGRTLLIGVYGTEPLASYFTPLSTSTEQTSDLLYHAFALDTLLAKRTIRIVPNWAMLLGMVGITVVTLIFCQYLAFQHSLLVALALTFCYGLGSWLVLHGFFMWIPPVELVLVQWLTIALAWRYRFAQENQMLNTTLFAISANLQDKAFPVSFYQAEDPWKELIVMINQTLNLSRIIFLEHTPPEDHRLKEIKAFNCSIDDVEERRRDYERTPYSTVIQENKPLLQEKPYLKALPGDDRQYLAPLIFAGEILGFWAFSIESIAIESPAKFLALTQAYTAQISEILYYRKELQKRQMQEKNALWTLFKFNTVAKPYQVLNQSVALLDKRSAQLQQVFNSLNTGCVLYDLFGRVLLVNHYMENLAQFTNLKLYNITALDLISAVSGCNITDARRILQKTIFDLEMISIPLSNFKVGRDYVLHIQPLKLSDNQNQLGDQAPVFQIVGVLCELEDVTELKAIYRLKGQIFERFSFQARDDLAAMGSALSIIEDATTSTAEKTEALGSVRGKIGEALGTLNSVNDQMAIEIESLASSLGRYPVNGQEAIKKAIAALKDYASLRTINLHLETPGLLGLVFASPIELYSVFRTVLMAMINDTFEGSDVWVEIEEKDEWVHYNFRSNGIGIAKNQLQQLNENAPLMSAELLKMDEVIHCVKYWEGRIDFSSQVGKGSTATLSLKRFL
jgi:CHASE2 domain-containing sensor protein/signal transduction histidine kinase